MAAFTGQIPVAPNMVKPGGAPPGGTPGSTKLQVTVAPINVIIQRGSNS